MKVCRSSHRQGLIYKIAYRPFTMKFYFVNKTPGNKGRKMGTHTVDCHAIIGLNVNP